MTRLSITPAAALLGCALSLGANTAHANLAYYAFGGSLDSGSLTGETYAGQFSFDDAGLTLTGPQSLALSSLSLGFHGRDFGLADAASPPTADFQDGVFLGVSVTVDTSDPTFSLVSGLVDTSDAYFAYTPSTGLSGYGSVTFTPTPVPLPGSLVFLLSGLAGLLGLGMGKRTKQA